MTRTFFLRAHNPSPKLYMQYENGINADSGLLA